MRSTCTLTVFILRICNREFRCMFKMPAKGGLTFLFRMIVRDKMMPIPHRSGDINFIENSFTL